MRALLCREYGLPEKLVVADLPDPVVGEGQVVVDVRAAAVNFPDYLMIQNKYQVSMPLPFVPGSEFAGVVSAVGPAAGDWRVGDRVCGASFVGAFGERIAVPGASLTAVPPAVDFAAAAAFFVVYGTAYGALHSVARLRAGETVLVLGAAGGVGLAAVQLAVHAGARVIAAASSEAKLAACRAEGAQSTVDYARQSLKAALKELTGGAGVDVVVDPVGGELSEQALRATGWGGRFVVVGFASGEIPRVPLNLPLLKGSQICAFNIAPFLSHQPDELRRNQNTLLELLAQGVIRPRISSRHPLAAAAAALCEVGERRAIGKVIVEMA